MAPAAAFKTCLLAAFVLPQVAANHFLSREADAEPTTAVSLLEELENVAGNERRQAAESRVARLEEVLRPTYLALPKDADGGLKPDAVRYALHRLFVDRHGWYVKGLEPGGDAWNSSSPAAVFQAHGGEHVHGLFQDRLGNHTFTLHHVAVLAATLESFVHSETVERLHAAYSLSGVAKHEDSATNEEVETVIETYMMLYVLGRNHSEVTLDTMNKYRNVIHKVYPTWEATRSWARQVRQEVILEDVSGASESFATTTKVVEEIADRYGRWQDAECQDIKKILMDLEVEGSGRVPVEAFYTAALNGTWQLSESVPYLRQSGILDESNPSWPSIMIPNYVNSPSNCVASSSFYEVCCINECEALFGKLEAQVGSPEASPDRLVELVSALPSATIEAPRKLSATLLARLSEIALQYDGMVPLHSRLFAQWLHHAYPRECPYPHLSGTTKPVTPKQYRADTGEKATATEETMQWHVDDIRQRGGNRPSMSDPDNLMWTSEDELFCVRVEPPAPKTRSRAAYAAKHFMLLCALFSAFVALSRKVKFASSSLGVHRPHEKYMV